MTVLLTWVLVLVWSLVGLAVLRVGKHRWSMPTVLLAPTVGFATVTVITYIFVRFGLPVRLLATPVVGVLLAASVVALWRGRPSRQRVRGLLRQGWPFALILATTFGLTGWPLFQYGFDWLANGNDDMANYCLMAAGYRDHGYAAVPSLDDLRAGRDLSRAYWFFFILLQVRPGSEILLALVSTITGISPQQVFMPVIVALNLGLVSAACGLAWSVSRRCALLTGLLLAVAAPMTYGVVQQLIAQIDGIALLCSSLALVSGRFWHLRTDILLRRAIACGMVFAGLVVFYLEVTPILVGGCIVLGVRDLVRKRLVLRHLTHAALAIAVMIALLPVYLYGAVSFLLIQSRKGGSSDVMAELFPYYLTPRGPAILWGLLPFAGPESSAYQNLSILLGLLLTTAVLVPAAAGLLRGRSLAAGFAAIVVLGGVLLAQRSAFGLFKLAMFVQPFLWGILGAWLAARRGRWSMRCAALLMMGVLLMNAHTQYWYVDQSRGHEYRVELPATPQRALSEFREAYRSHVAAGDVDRILLATNNSSLLKLIGSEIRGIPVAETGYAPITALVVSGFQMLDDSPWLKLHPDWSVRLQSMQTEYAAVVARGRLTVVDPDSGKALHRLMLLPADPVECARARVLVVAGGGSLSVLNRRQFPEDGRAIVCEPLSKLQNFAVFCDATGARQDFSGYLEEPKSVSLHRLEIDAIFRKHTVAGAGRAVVLDVLNPSPRVRVVVNYTASYLRDARVRTLAPAQVVGDRRVSLGAIGSGAARLVSPPLAVQAVGPARFLVVDFGPVSHRNPNDLTSVDRLWGAEFPRDRRWLTGHVRDISIISDEEYAAFRPPEALACFPDDLAQPQLEFSGFFEEGWVASEAKVRLTEAAPDDDCVIRGMVPGLPGATDFETELTVLIDETTVTRRILKPGEFEVRIPRHAGAGVRWVGLRFSRIQTLPAPDGRTVAAHIHFIGFERHTKTPASHPPEKLSVFPTDLRNPALEQHGIWPDGWAAKDARARLTQIKPGAEAVVRGQVPEVGGNAAFRTQVSLLLDGQVVAQRVVGPGSFELRAPAGKMTQARWVECRFTDTQSLPLPDGRSAGAHIRFLGFESPQPEQ